MQRRPIYVFETTSTTGLDKVPVGSTITVTSTGVSYFVSNKTSITGSTTVAQAVTAANLTISGGGGAGASLTSYTFTATANQTAFVTTGTTLSATPLVFLNGALQQITATYTVSGLTVTFVNARAANDSIVIVG
jgi:spore germination protein YaaH